MKLIKNLVKSKKIIIIWLWRQWLKLIDFLIWEWVKDNIIWVCKTQKTKKEIEKQYSINVDNNYIQTIKSNLNNIAFIFIGVNPLKNQEEIYINILKDFSNNKILIEKSFIEDKKTINLLKHKNYPHAIVKNENLYLNFFKEIIKKNIITKNNLKKLVIKIELNNNIYEKIINKKVYLLSYIWDYLYFLKPEIINYNSISWNYKAWYKIFLDINWKIPVIIIMKKLKQQSLTNNTILYKLENNKSCLFNNTSNKSKILNYYIDNYDQSIEKKYSSVFFLKWKIIDLLQNKVKIKKEIAWLKYFRKLNNDLNKKLIFKKLSQK